MGDAVARRAPPGPSVFVATFDQDLEFATHETLVQFGLEPGLEFEEPGEPLGRHLLRDERLSPPPRRRGSRPRRVAERKNARKPRRADQIESRREIFLGLSRKADDEVGRDGDCGERRPHPADFFEVLGHGVAALHPVQDAVRPGLRRQVEVRRDVSAGGERFDHRIVDEARVRRQKSQSPDSRDPRHFGEQLPEPRPVLRIAIGIDGLSQKRDFAVATPDERAHFFEDLGGPPAALPAPREGNDAERAELAAPLDHRDICGEAGTAGDLTELVHRRLDRQLERENAASLRANLIDELAHALDVARPQDEVDPGRPFQDLVPFDLGDAPGDPDDELRKVLLAAAEHAQGAVDLCLRFFPDGAGVQDHDVRRFFGAGRAEAAALELTGHALAVQDVHLAAPGLDAEGRRVAHSRNHPGSAPARRARSGRSSSSFSAPGRAFLAVARSSRVLSHAGLMTRSRYAPSSQA